MPFTRQEKDTICEAIEIIITRVGRELRQTDNPTPEKELSTVDSEVENQNEGERFYTIKEFCKKHSWPTEHSIRWMMFNAEQNGFDKVVRRVGRRILIKENEFYNWVNSKSNL